MSQTKKRTKHPLKKNKGSVRKRTPTSSDKYDCIVIGGGSGGLTFANRAFSYHKSVLVIEKSGRMGGTCMNTGCIPKKMMYHAAHVAHTIKDAKEFGFTNPAFSQPKIDWKAMKSYRDKYISRISENVQKSMDETKLEYIYGNAHFVAEIPEKYKRYHSVQIACNDGETKIVHGKHIVIATGGVPKPLGVPGDEYTINSDGFFLLEKQPKKMAMIGGGYIAVEIAGLMNEIGTDTTIFIRSQRILRSFDDMLAAHLDKTMQKNGIHFVKDAIIEKITKDKHGKYTIHLSDHTQHTGFDSVIEATGRFSLPYTSTLGLEHVKVKYQTEDGIIPVDKYQNTNVPGIYALGDVCGRLELATTAIAAARCLADRLFRSQVGKHISYENVPTVVFSHPPIGTVGLTETQAIEKYGKKNIHVYNKYYIDLWYASFNQGNGGEKPLSKNKIICAGKNQKIVGIHIIGMHSDEIMQGFAVAMNMGVTKSDMEASITIHPTTSEGLVSLT